MRILYTLFLLFLYPAAEAQQITGVWKGRIGSGMRPRKVELKLVQKGDSIFGTAYYYESANNFKRYTVKGFFDRNTNGVIWWDQMQVDAKNPRVKLLSPGDNLWLSEADFNCPGDGRMMLDGSARPKNDDDARIQKLHFDKVEKPTFNDEWDFVIDNYMYGANDPFVIDSVAAIAANNLPPGADPRVVVTAPPGEEPALAKNEKPAPPAPVEPKPVPEPPVVKNTPPPPPPEEPPLPPLEKAGETAMDIPSPVLKDAQQRTVKGTPKNLPVTKPPETPPVAVATPPEPKPTSKPAPPVNRPPIVVVPPPKPAEPVVVKNDKPANNGANEPAVNAGKTVTPPQPVPVVVAAAPEIKQKFEERSKVVALEIPAGDSIELRFYDNAEVDGDSISLFLNNQLIFQHIRLSDKPYIVKLSGNQLKDGNQLTMVAENLGAIPPNTSYMVAYVNDTRYEATLSSSEQSSAVIRFRKR